MKRILIILMSLSFLTSCSRAEVNSIDIIERNLVDIGSEIKTVLMQSDVNIDNPDALLSEIRNVLKFEDIGDNRVIIRSYDVARIIERESSFRILSTSNRAGEELLKIIRGSNYITETIFSVKDIDKFELASAILGDFNSYIEILKSRSDVQHIQEKDILVKEPTEHSGTTYTSKDKPHILVSPFKYREKTIELLDVKYGPEVNKKYAELSRYNKSPREGYIYVELTFDTDVDGLDFSFYDEKYKAYNKVIMEGLDSNVVIGEIKDTDDELVMTYKLYEKDFVYLKYKLKS